MKEASPITPGGIAKFALGYCALMTLYLSLGFEISDNPGDTKEQFVDAIINFCVAPTVLLLTFSGLLALYGRK